jgi:hypothetical protein
MSEVNPRAVSGDNTNAPDYALQESQRLRIDYALLETTVTELETEAQAILLGPDGEPIKPGTVIQDNDGKGKVTSMIKRIRDAATRANSFRESEKQPHFRRGQGVDMFFFGLIDRLSKRDKKNRDGVGDALQRELNEYDNRLLLEEQARRRAAAEAAQREADRLAAEERDKARIAEEARLAAERARKPETTAAKEAIANTAEVVATEAAIAATLATNKAEDLHVQTLARPADIMRNRGVDGTLSTMAREGYAEIEDDTKLDMAKLWPFISLDAKEKALRQWAKSVGYRQEMAGAVVGFRNKSVVR